MREEGGCSEELRVVSMAEEEVVVEDSRGVVAGFCRDEDLEEEELDD